MSKYLNRLAARLTRDYLRESAKEGKNWIVSKKLILETDEGDFELDKNEEIEIGGDNEGNLVLNGGQAACVIVADEELARKIADLVVSSDELSDVEFVEKPALDAVMDGEDVDDVIDKLADNDMDSEDEEPSNTDEIESDDVETAEMSIDQKESVENKFSKFAKNILNPVKTVKCESILVDESDETPLNLALIKRAKTIKENFTDYNSFVTRVSELKGSLQPGKREIALGESGKVIGAFDKNSSSGKLYCEAEFDDVEEMDNFDDSDVNVMDENRWSDDPKLFNKQLKNSMADDTNEIWDHYGPEEIASKFEELKAEAMTPNRIAEDLALSTNDPWFKKWNPEGNDLSMEELENYIYTTYPDVAAESCSVSESIEKILKKYEESTKTGADYMNLTRRLNKCNLEESVISKIVGTFNNKSLKECVRAYDSKYGKYVACFKESVECDNFIAETKDEKRFTKRFFN